VRRPPLFLTAAAVLILGWSASRSGSYGALLAWNLLLQLSLALSYDILGGYGSEMPLGHGLFFGLGAYGAGGMLQAGLPWGWALAAAGSAGLLAAALIRPLLLPLRGASFALGSLTLLLLASLLARNLEGLTGGSAGLSLPRGTWGIGPPAAALALASGALALHRRLPRSRFGRALRAAGDDPQAASQAGVPVARVRGAALVLGALPAALAGGLYPLRSGYLSPEAVFGLQSALTPVVAVLLGGPGTPWGALCGTLLFFALQELLWTHLGDWNLTLLGAALMALALWRPGGLAGGAASGGRRSRKRPWRAPRG
jgi:branched-chain amino acid transport system permease protein